MMSNDAFYYGVLSVLVHPAEAYGITTAEIGRASMVDQPVHLLSPLVASTYLLAGLAGMEFSDHQKYTFKCLLLLCLVIMATSMAFGLYPWYTSAA
jgi:CitMHS family citrate-Mg2+:H+ or citrate-Ca2+:H+ symporter